jgi:cell division protein FtsL
MTIIQPNKYKDIKRLMFSMGVFIVGIILVWVFVYLQTVNLRHDTASAKKSLEEAKVENAELKNRYYGIVDSENLENLARERGFVNDKNPQWAFASRL